MPRFQVLLSVEGSSRFTIEADNLEAAKAMADKMLDDHDWEPASEDHQYEIVDVREVS